MGRRDPSGSPLWQPLLQRATATPESHFALLALFQHRRDITQDNLETMLDLVRRGWESGIPILKLDALHFLRWTGHDLPDVAVAQICEMLNGFETDNIFENTFLTETLCHFGAVESPVTIEDALQEMRSTIASGSGSDPDVIEAAKILNTRAGRPTRRSCERLPKQDLRGCFRGSLLRGCTLSCHAKRNPQSCVSRRSVQTSDIIPTGCCENSLSTANATRLLSTSGSRPASTASPGALKTRRPHFCSQSKGARGSWTRHLATREATPPRIVPGR